MQLSDLGFARELRCFELAHRMVEFEARTSTISTWTGLPERRIRRMYQSMLAVPGTTLVRVRGPPPSDYTLFLASPVLRTESAAAAVLCELCGAMPSERGPRAVERLPSLARGERLCRAWEIFCVTVPQHDLTFEHLVFLTATLALGESMKLDHCASCDGTIVLDVDRARRKLCAGCRGRSRAVKPRLSTKSDEYPDRDAARDTRLPCQGSLF